MLVGGLMAAICLLVLVPMIALPPTGVGLAGTIAVVALYLGMLVVRLVVKPGRRRLGLMAAGMLGIAAVTLVAVLVVAGAAAAVGAPQ